MLKISTGNHIYTQGIYSYIGNNEVLHTQLNFLALISKQHQQSKRTKTKKKKPKFNFFCDRKFSMFSTNNKKLKTYILNTHSYRLCSRIF